MPPPDARRMARRVYHAEAAERQLWFGVIALSICGLLPWSIGILRGLFGLGSVGIFLDALYLPACHRLAERSLTIGHAVMPVCSRCAGIYLGLAAGALAEWQLNRSTLNLATNQTTELVETAHASNAQSKRRIRLLLMALVAAGIVLSLEVVAQDYHWLPMSHPRRLGTGLLLGSAAAAALVASLRRNLGLVRARARGRSPSEKKS